MAMLEVFRWTLKTRREKEGYSLEAFAEKLGISKTTLQNIEQGEANPTLGTIQQIAKRLGVSPLALLSEEYDEEKLQTAQMILEMLERFSRLSARDRRRALETFDHLVKILTEKKED